MAIKNTLEGKMTYRIKRSEASVFLRRDFEDLGGYDQVGYGNNQRPSKNANDPDTIIYDTKGTDNMVDDDDVLMVLQDFSVDLEFKHFEIVVDPDVV